VGFMQVIPNSRNVIPGCVRFSAEFRHPTMAGVQRMESLLRAKIAALNAQGRVSVEMTLVSEYDASHFDSVCVDAVRQASKTLGLPSMEVVSGAAHDAVCVSRHSPTAMIFIPCKDGISHNEIEDARQDHVEAGANVLLLAMLTRAGVV
jgi:beta-ureidopropionase / N-carbamoyl-L-amino-acid hydrolase